MTASPPREQAEAWIRETCDRNSESELAALKRASERDRLPMADIVELTRPRLAYPEVRYDELLRQTAARAPDRTAIVYDDVPHHLPGARIAHQRDRLGAHAGARRSQGRGRRAHFEHASGNRPRPSWQ